MSGVQCIARFNSKAFLILIFQKLAKKIQMSPTSLFISKQVKAIVKATSD